MRLAVGALLLLASSAQAGDASGFCQELARQGVLGRRVSLPSAIWGGIRYVLDRRKFARLREEDLGVPQPQTGAPLKTVILDLLPPVPPGLRPISNGEARRRFLEVYDRKFANLIKAKDAEECERRADEAGIGEADVEMRFALWRDLQEDVQPETNRRAHAALDQVVSRLGADATFQAGATAADLLSVIRSAVEPTRVVLVAHGDASGRFFDSEGKEVPINILREASSYVRSVYVVACDGEQIRDRYSPAFARAGSGTRVFGYVKTGKLAGMDVKLSTRALRPILGDILDSDHPWSPAPERSDPEPLDCRVAIGSPQGSVALLAAGRLLAIGAGEELAVPCSAIPARDRGIQLSRRNDAPVDENHFPPELLVTERPGEAPTRWVKEATNFPGRDRLYVRGL